MKKSDFKRLNVDFDFILRSVPGYVYWKNAHSVYLGGNQNFANLADLQSVENIPGQTDYTLPWGIKDPKAAEQFVQDDQFVTQTGKVYVSESKLLIKNADGNNIQIRTEKKPLINKNGEIVGILGIAIDITDQKQAEELRLKNTVNEEKMEAMKMLAASIAHELRTPLAAIKAQGSVIQILLPTLIKAYHLALEADMLQKPLRNSQVEFLEHLPEELNRITSSANVFIDMLLTKVNFESLKEKSIQLIRLQAKKALMDALNHYPLDDYSAGLLKVDYKNSFDFMGDDVLFQHVIFNLLKNAIYYVRSTGRPGEIKIWFEQQKNQNILHFKDTGKGINKESLPNIFNSFYSRSRHGTGVGLAFCKMIVESFGGAITCDSVEDKYTHFMLSFPKVENAK